MDTILDRILATKAQELTIAKAELPLNEMRAQAEHQTPARDFFGAIKAKHQAGLAAIIAEIKKASPSKGLIRPDFQPEIIAKAYVQGEAACMSVLTDAHYFQGKLEYLRLARVAAPLPALRKDFIIDAYQIYQSRAWGADAILLIAASLDRHQLTEFEQIAHSLNMTVLLEIHDESELDKCVDMQTPLWGINNRDLHTFKVDINHTIRLLPQLSDKTVVTESGIFTTDDIRFMQQHGVNTFLIGESLMRSDPIPEALNQLVHA
ncbi:indole-3-glycerol phosphate synthase TrpC [Neisseriaceae bacterium ESL0693]|nr:indole-3-glycerol phosphate synthase TrpC [Neisseriaceae bacterium ESL0693]